MFRLIEASPLLKRVYRRVFVQELCAEASKGPADGEQQLRDQGIEYLELYAHLELDTHTQACSGTTRLNLHGVGPMLQQDHPDQHWRKGQRIEWNVSLTPLRALLALPVRVNHRVLITEGGGAAQAWGQEIGSAQVEEVTLGQVLDGLLWELSFHGGPAEQSGVLEDLQCGDEDMDDDTDALTTEELFESLGITGCEAMFDEFGGHRPSEVEQALRDIRDAENAAEWIARRFEGRVIVKPEFRHLSGREFRRSCYSPRI